MQSHYLNQCWKIVYWTLRNKLQWNPNRNSYIFIQENAFEKSSRKGHPFYLGLNLLTQWSLVMPYGSMGHSQYWFKWLPIACYTKQSADLTWGWGKMAAILQTTHAHAFFLNENCCILIQISLKFVPKDPPIFQRWFRLWLGAKEVTIHYLKQWWASLLTHICITWPQWVKITEAIWHLLVHNIIIS